MTDKTKQDELLDALNDEQTFTLLYDCWTLIKRAPGRAVEILMQFKDVSGSAKVACADIQDALTRWESLKPRIAELGEAAKRVAEFNRQVAATNEETVLNRLNRIVVVAEQMARLKKDGGLDIIEKLLKT